MKLKTTSCGWCGGSGKVTDFNGVGGQLAAERKKADITLRALAGEMGISPAYLSDLENGRRAMNALLLDRYNSALEALR